MRTITTNPKACTTPDRTVGVVHVDVMTDYGNHFYASLRITLRRHYDFDLQQWVANLDDLRTAVFDKLPTLRNRKDVRIIPT